MKVNLVLILLTFGARSLLAQFVGLDDFAGAGKDPSKWGADIQFGSGMLTQSGDGSLRFSATGNSGDDVMEWPWIFGDAPFTNSWSIQADVHVPMIELADGFTAAGIGIGIRNSGDTSDSFGVNLENVRSSGEAQQFNFYNRLRINGSTTETSVTAPSVQAAVRISWNASTKTLSAEYDSDGAASGYVWTVFNTFDPTANNWNMTGTNSFQIFIRGYAEETAVTLGNDVYLDNFFVLDDSRPSLSVSRDGDNVLLTWPRLALGYKLEASTTLTPDDWLSVSDTPVIVGDQNTLSLGLSDSKNFFRLKK